MTTSEHIREISDPKPSGFKEGIRRDEMRLKNKHSSFYGGLRVQGFKQASPVCPTCDRLLVWCECNQNAPG